MAKLVWRLKLIAELERGVVSETEVARIERDNFAAPRLCMLSPICSSSKSSVLRCGGGWAQRMIDAYRLRAIQARPYPSAALSVYGGRSRM